MLAAASSRFFAVKWRNHGKQSFSALGGAALRPSPACHVFTVVTDNYAYDLHTQQILSVEPELAAVLRGERGTAAARAVLRRAQEEDGLFLARRPRLVPAKTEVAADVDQNLQHLVLTVTEACNMRCAYCLHGSDLGWVRSHGEGTMSVSTALSAVSYFLDRCDPERAPVISFYGGEALLNREVITAVVEAARDHQGGDRVKFVIDSNGILLDDEIIELVVREKIFLQLSIDGPARIHDFHRVDVAGRPTWERILANIGRLLDRDRSAAGRLTFVITMAPPIDVFGVAALFADFPPYVERGIDRKPTVTANFANLEGQNWEAGEEKAAGLPTVAIQMDQAREIYLSAFAAQALQEVSPVIRALFEPELIRLYHRSRAPLSESYVPGGNCLPGRRKLHVSCGGDLHPCERTGDMFPLGMVATGIRGEKVEELTQGFHAAVVERCGDCWALRMCGVCFATHASFGKAGSPSFPVPDSVCQRVRQQREVTLKMMVRVLSLPRECRDWLDGTELV